MKPSTPPQVSPTNLEALRMEASQVFDSSVDPDFRYGLNVFFAPSSIRVPNAITISKKVVAPEYRKAPGTIVLGTHDQQHPSASSHLSGPRNLTAFPAHTLPEDVSRNVVSSGAVLIMDLSAALEDSRFADLIRERLSIAVGDRIDAWNIASLHDGVFVYVPEGVTAEAPVRVDLRLSDSERADCNFVVAEKGSSVTVVEHLASVGDGAKLRASRTEIIARAGASVKHVSVQDFGDSVTSYDRRRALVEKGASVSWTDCAFGGGYVRSRISTELAGETASAKMLGMSFAANAQRHDIRHEVVHSAAHTNSDLRSRIALDGHAKAIYRSLVRVAPGAAGCAGMQKEDTLLLAPDVEISAMPDLEIGTGEVRARHSASAGKLNRENIFYLMSRGLSEDQAKKTLIEAFFAPIVADMRGSGLDDMVECLVAARLEVKKHD